MFSHRFIIIQDGKFRLSRAMDSNRLSEVKCIDGESLMTLVKLSKEELRELDGMIFKYIGKKIIDNDKLIGFECSDEDFFRNKEITEIKIVGELNDNIKINKVLRLEGE